MQQPIDTTNKFLVAAQGDSIVFFKPLPMRINRPDALLLAAYLVAMVCDDVQWDAVRAAVENT